MVFELGSSDINELGFTFNNNLFLKDRIQHEVYFVFDVFNNQTLTLFHAIFEEIILKFGVGYGCYGFLGMNKLRKFVFYPIWTLRLGVDEHGVPSWVGDHDTVLDTQIILGQTLEVPLSNSGFIHQEAD